MDKGAASIGSSGHSAFAIPCNFDAIEYGDQLEAVLRWWASQISLVSPYFAPPRIAERLLNQVKHIRRRERAGDLMFELRDALKAGRRATDRAARPCPGQPRTTPTRWACRGPHGWHQTGHAHTSG